MIISAQCCISYGNQSFDFHCKSNDWFRYEMQHWAETAQVAKIKITLVNDIYHGTLE